MKVRIVRNVTLVCMIISIFLYSKIQNAERRDLDLTMQAQSSSTDASIDNILEYMGLSYEILAYEIIEDIDIENQLRYEDKYFVTGKRPKSDALWEYKDLDRIKQECPALRDLWENGEKYTTEEFYEIYNANIDVIEKYTYYIHPKSLF